MNKENFKSYHTDEGTVFEFDYKLHSFVAVVSHSSNNNGNVDITLLLKTKQGVFRHLIESSKDFLKSQDMVLLLMEFADAALQGYKKLT